jgi:hypothetical protein
MRRYYFQDRYGNGVSSITCSYQAVSNINGQGHQGGIEKEYQDAVRQPGSAHRPAGKTDVGGLANTIREKPDSFSPACFISRLAVLGRDL